MSYTAIGHAGAVVANLHLFDPALFGLRNASEPAHLDPQQRQILHRAVDLRHRAAGNADGSTGSSGVYVGISMLEYARLLDAHAQATPFTATGSHLSVAAGRVSFAFGYGGPALSVDTARSSSLVAIHVARKNGCSNSACDAGSWTTIRSAQAGGVTCRVEVDRPS